MSGLPVQQPKMESETPSGNTWIIVYAAQALVQLILAITSAFSSGHRVLRRSLVVCQSLNVLFFLPWVILGLYCVIHGCETLMDNATRLFWTAVVFLALPLIAVGLFCLCLPCICCCGACLFCCH